jgi:3-oxoacyl-(acyl-carrier-protein) synthase/SAM-dependent methyltransferase
LLAAVLDRYADVLRGALDPVELLFPNGTTALVEGAYAGNPVSDHLNALLAAAVAARGATGQRLRVIEIGAGTGATAAVVLPRLQAAGITFDYLFTDVSRRFLTDAEARFGPAHPGLATALYDAERDVEENGLAPGRFDVVIATNVLHATASLPRTMARLGRLLAPGGLIAVNEVTRRQDFATLVFGLTEGWWRGAAEPGRLPGAPLVDAAGWDALLRAAGCAATAAHTPAEDAGGGQTLLLGLLPGTPMASAAAPAVIAAPPPAAAVLDAIPSEAPPRLVAHLRAIFHTVLKLPPEEFRLHDGFDGYGLESLTALDIRNRIAIDFPDVPATLLFEQNTLARLARHLVSTYPAEAARFIEAAAVPALPSEPPAPRATVADKDAPIAIIGFAGRFPGGADAAAFWRLLDSGERAIAEIPSERWDAAAWFDPAGAEGRAHTRWAGLIEGVDRFDPLFFGLSPLEAETMDPQERLFLETAWATLEAAGTTPKRLVAQAGAVGVFAGVMNTPYQWLAAEAWAQGHAQAGSSAFWSIPNRVSHSMDLGGPSIAVDTACSSSLTAIHLACESIRRGECGAAIAGGVNLILHPRQLVNLSAAGMVTPGDACRTFADGADGFVDGEGVGAVLLKPLDAALRDGDRIEGVILGSAINSGGRTSGFTVPNPAAQARAIGAALARAGVPPGSMAMARRGQRRCCSAR